MTSLSNDISSWLVDSQTIERYQCSICLCLLEIPHFVIDNDECVHDNNPHKRNEDVCQKCTPCMHSFCKICLDTLKKSQNNRKCPLCNQQWSQCKSIRNINLEREMALLKICCPRCKWIGELGYRRNGYLKHIFGCREMMVSCEFCNISVLHKHLQTHKDECNHLSQNTHLYVRQPLLENNGSTLMGILGIVQQTKDTETSKAEIVKIVNCQFSILGCTWRGTRNTMEQHFVEDNNIHLKIIRSLTKSNIVLSPPPKPIRFTTPNQNVENNIHSVNSVIQVGDIVDCKNQTNNWFLAAVKQINSDSLIIHYLGCLNNRDECVHSNAYSYRLRPPWSHSHGRVGCENDEVKTLLGISRYLFIQDQSYDVQLRYPCIPHPQLLVQLLTEKCNFCETLLARCDLEDHCARKCKKREIPCENKCGGSVRVHDLKTHKSICKFEKIECDYDGCSWKGIRENLHSHLQDNKWSHFFFCTKRQSF